jgi:hypothetical protein
LKQAGHRWYETLTHTLANLGFCTSQADPAVFHAQVAEEILILMIHIDNCTLMGSLSALITQYKQKLNACFPLTDLGPINWLLGIKITHDCPNRTTLLLQWLYIDSVLTWFGLQDAHGYATQMVPGTLYSHSDIPTNTM